MSKIKNLAKGILYSIPILVGAEEALAQDITQVASDNSKKIEIAQSIKVDTTLEKIRIKEPEIFSNNQDSTDDFNSDLMTVNNVKVGDQIVRSDTSI